MKKLDSYDYTDELKSRLLARMTIVQVSKEFNSKTDNSDRIKFLHKLLKDEKLLPDYTELKIEKSNNTADLYRNDGNTSYKSKNFYDALVHYNMSLCYAKADSLAKIFFNKSAVYYEMQDYDECLENIQLARNNHYTDVEKLNKRQSACLEKINNELPKKVHQSEESHEIKLSYEAK